MNEDFLNRLSALAKEADNVLRELRAEMVQARKLSQEIDQKREEVRSILRDLTNDNIAESIADWAPELRSQLQTAQSRILDTYTARVHSELNRLERIWMNNPNQDGQTFKGIFEMAEKLEASGDKALFVKSDTRGRPMKLPPSAK